MYTRMFGATWGGWDEARHQRHFTASWQRGQFQLVEVNAQPVGMIQLRETDGCVTVGEIQILPAHQNRGLGTQLLVEVIDRATEQGQDVIRSMGLMNSDAQRLYERLGFEETERSATHVHMRCRARDR